MHFFYMLGFFCSFAVNALTHTHTDIYIYMPKLVQLHDITTTTFAFICF